MRTVARLTLRLHRFEVLAVVGGSFLLAALAADAARSLDRLAPPLSCFRGDAAAEVCQATEWGIVRADSERIMAAMAVLPFVAGALLGVPLVGREIDHGTAPLAWSLAGSRLRWFAPRLLVVATVLAVALSAAALAAEALSRASNFWLDPETTTFVDYGIRGPLVVLRGLAAFSIAILAGAALGRVLPALVATAVACVVLYQVAATAQWSWLPEPERMVERPDRWALEYEFIGYADASGSFLTAEAAAARAPMSPEEESFEAWFTAAYDPVIVGTDGERLRQVASREAAGLGALALVLIGGSAVVVRRRRPT